MLCRLIKIKGEMKNEKGSYSVRNIDLSLVYAKNRNAVKSLEGVERESISVSFNSSKVKLDFDDEKISIKDIENAINKLGYEVKKSQVKG